MMQWCALCQENRFAPLQSNPQCSACKEKVCPKCFDNAARLCRRCTQPPVSNVGCQLFCGICNEKAGMTSASPRCLQCQRLLCERCIREWFGAAASCTRCPMQSHQRQAYTRSQIPAPTQMPSPQPPQQQQQVPAPIAAAISPSFRCHRCFKGIALTVSGALPSDVEFCHDCARTLCAECAPRSMHKGKLVCKNCVSEIKCEIFQAKAPPQLRQGNEQQQQQRSPSPLQVQQSPVQPTQPLQQQPSQPPQQAYLPAVSVQLSTREQVSMCTDESELKRRFGFIKGARVHYAVQDCDERIGSVDGFTNTHIIVQRLDAGGAQPSGTYDAVTPGFCFEVANPSLSSSPPQNIPSSQSTAAAFQLGNWQFVPGKEFLGQGAQGVVSKCTTLDGRCVVLKEMQFCSNEADIYRTKLEQNRYIMSLKHDHLIQYLDVVGEATSSSNTSSSNAPSSFKITVIMPYYKEKDLLKFIQELKESFVKEEVVCSLALQIAGALEYLHTRNPPLIHRDVKPDNILMFDQGKRALLMDLDTCKTLGAAGQRTMTTNGTMEYSAPEALAGRASPKSDVWSLGVVMLILAALPNFTMVKLNGRDTLLNDSVWTEASLRREVIQAIGQRSRTYSKKFVELVLAMLQHDEGKRPSIQNVIAELHEVMEDLLLGQAAPMDWGAQ